MFLGMMTCILLVLNGFSYKMVIFEARSSALRAPKMVQDCPICLVQFQSEIIDPRSILRVEKCLLTYLVIILYFK